MAGTRPLALADLVPLVRSERRLPEVGYLAFPFATDGTGAAVADRSHLLEGNVRA